ncbi:putative syntaxin binding protein [Trypanosoma cruzi]|uniref:Putative syntaxin binding protein n=1 Tax=Trypanosoma cruzi TaxID=5693 RepID=A0A2V2V6V9_TRYCR|nr:putative syntaxin binding protein [Trypanosoma cruzi]
MLDAFHGSFKVFFCDAHAAAVLNCSLRLHELMKHSVTLLGDLMTPRRPIMSSPAPYFFVVEDASVSRVAEDWMAKVPYRDAHIFALGCTPHRRLQQLVWTRIAPRAMRLKEIMLDFAATEVPVFHLSMQNRFPQLLSSLSPPTRESVLNVAESLIVAAFYAMNNGVPVIRHQNRGSICHGFARTFFEGFSGSATTSRISLRGADSYGNPVRIIVDWGFVTVTPLLHQRTC